MDINALYAIFGIIISLYAIVVFLDTLDFPNTQYKDFKNIEKIKTQQINFRKCRDGKNHQIDNIPLRKICLIYFLIPFLRIISMVPIIVLFFGFSFIIIGNVASEKLVIDLSVNGEWLLYLGVILEILIFIIRIIIGLPQSLMKLAPGYDEKPPFAVVFEIYPIFNLFD